MNPVIGIDNGISGGIAVLSPSAGVAPLAMIPMPTQRSRGKNVVDVVALRNFLRSTLGGMLPDALVLIEEPGGSKSAQAAVSMAASFHAVRAMLDVTAMRWESVTPRTWQKAMIPGAKPGETKGAALTIARRLWPEETWLATPKCRTPHDGMIDAALIAEFGRRARI